MFFRIGKKRSRLRMSSSRESTHRFSATFPCLIPMPYGCERNRSLGQLGGWIGHGDAEQRAVVEHQVSARPSRNAISAFEKTSVTMSFVSLKQFLTQRS